MQHENASAWIRLCAGLNDRIGRFAAWLSVALVLVTFAVVVLRYALDWGSIGMQELSVYLHSALFMLGAAYTLQHDGHVRVDILYQRFSSTGKAWVNLLGAAFLLIPVSVFLGWISWEYVSSSWAILETSAEAGGLPGVFLLKSLIPLMTLMLVLQGLVQIGTSIAILQGKLCAQDEEQDHAL